MNVKLNMPERYMVLNTLPSQGNFLTLRALNEFRAKLYPTEEEVKEMNLVQKGSKVEWNEKGNIEKDFEVGELMFSIIAKELKRMDKENLLTNNHISIYRKFVEEPGEEAK